MLKKEIYKIYLDYCENLSKSKIENLKGEDVLMDSA